MRVLKKMVLNDYVELTNRQTKFILGGSGSGAPSCMSSSDCSGWCGPVYDGGTIVSRTCKKNILISGCSCQ